MMDLGRTLLVGPLTTALSALDLQRHSLASALGRLPIPNMGGEMGLRLESGVNAG